MTLDMGMSSRLYLKSIILFSVYFFAVLTALSYLLNNKKQIVYFEWGSGRIEDKGNFIKTELKLNFNLFEKINLPFEHVSLGLGPLYFLKVLSKEHRGEEAYNLVKLIVQYLNAEKGMREYYSEEYGANLEEVLVLNQSAEVFRVDKNELILGVPPIISINSNKCFDSYANIGYLELHLEKSNVFVDKDGDKVVICVDK